MDIARYERRVFAYLIDVLLCLGCAFLTWSFIPWMRAFPLAAQIVVLEVMMGLYYMLFGGILLKWSNGYTLGGALLRTKVVHMDDRDITYRDAFIRSVCLSIIPWVLVNAIYMLIVHTERTICDKITDTIVIDRRNWK